LHEATFAQSDIWANGIEWHPHTTQHTHHSKAPSPLSGIMSVTAWHTQACTHSTIENSAQVLACSAQVHP